MTNRPKARGPGRPSLADVQTRSREVQKLALSLVATKPEVVSAIARKLGVGAAAVRKDLEAAVEGLDDPPEMPEDLRKALANAREVPEIEAAIAAVRDAQLAGKINERVAASLNASLKLQLAAIEKRAPDVEDELAQAIDILTPQEWAAVEEVRAKTRTPAMKPGEGAPPPPEDEVAT